MRRQDEIFRGRTVLPASGQPMVLMEWVRARQSVVTLRAGDERRVCSKPMRLCAHFASYWTVPAMQGWSS